MSKPRTISDDIRAAEAAEAAKAGATETATTASGAGEGDEVAKAASNQGVTSVDAVDQVTFAITDAIPIPTGKRVRESKYPYDKLGVGQSFFVPGGKTESFSSQIVTRNKKGTAHFIVRGWEENGQKGVRVWRDK